MPIFDHPHPPRHDSRMAKDPTGDPALGARLRGAREAAELTQDELAAKIGILQGSISAFETGAVMPSVETLAKIVDATRSSMDYLTGKGEMAQELEKLETILLNSLNRRVLRHLKEADEATLRGLARDFAALAEARIAPTRTGGAPKPKAD